MKKTRPISDPVVAEVRKVRTELFAQCGNKMSRLFARIRRQEQAQQRQTISRSRRKISA